jgi:small GTP-binding protein
MSAAEVNPVSYRIVVIGEVGVGKSALIIRFIQNLFVPDWDPSIEDSFRKTMTVDGINDVLDIYDIGEQVPWTESSLEPALRKADGVIMVYSISNRYSFERLCDDRHTTLLVKEAESWPMLIVAAKSDLEGERVISSEEALLLAKRWNVPHIEVSSKLGTNVQAPFEEIIRLMRQRRVAETRTPSDTQNKRGFWCNLL